MQQNAKIEDLEIAHSIIKILYLLPTSRSEIYKILIQIPDFENRAIQELEKKFEDAYQRLIDHYQLPLIFINEQNIRPLSIKLGQLKSDFRKGLSKFYNKSPFDSLEMFKNQNKLTSVMLDILKEPGSYTLRERVSREPEILKIYLQSSCESFEFQTGLKLVQIFLKYNKNYLSLPPNQIIIDMLRRPWIKLSEQSLDEILSKL